MTEINEVLAERGERYGEFADHARVSQMLKYVIKQELSKRKKVLDDDQQEAIDMICHKLARIVNGDPNYADSWVDIAGYAQLIANRVAK